MAWWVLEWWWVVVALLLNKVENRRLVVMHMNTISRNLLCGNLVQYHSTITKEFYNEQEK